MPAPTREELAAAPTYRSVIGTGDDGEPPLSDPYRALRRDGLVWTSQGERLPPDDFVAHGVRCSPEGLPVAPLTAPLHIQALGVRTFLDAFPAADMGAHLDDIRVLRAALGGDPAEMQDDAASAEAHMADAMLVHVRDVAVPQGTQARPPEEPRGPDPVIRLMSRDTGIDEGEWSHASDMPAYQVETMRAMARQMLSPIMGNAASLEDLRFIMVPLDEPERSGALRRWIRGAEGSRTLPPFRHPAMPTYVTDEPVLAERDGVALLTYRDRFGSYAWAWDTNPDARLELPGPEDGEDGPRFR